MVEKETTVKLDLNTATVGQLSGGDHRKAEVFRNYGIDFCCGGRKKVAEAARDAGIAEEELFAALRAAETATVQPETDWSAWTPGQLVEYITTTHHRYVRESLPVIIEFAHKVSNRHGDRHPELVALNQLVRQEAHDLFMHLDKEEMGLFPMIEGLSGIAKPVETTEGGACCTASNPGVNRPTNVTFVRQAVSRMKGDHTHSGESLEGFRKLTNNYTPPQNACNSFRFLYQKLQEFDLDLQQHIHLENNILFPNALALLD